MTDKNPQNSPPTPTDNSQQSPSQPLETPPEGALSEETQATNQKPANTEQEPVNATQQETQPADSSNQTQTAENSEADDKKNEEVVSQIEQNKKNANTIKTRMRMVLEIGSLAIIALIMISGLLLYYAERQIPLLKSNKEQIAASLYNSSDIQNTVSFLESQEGQTDAIAAALPVKENLIDFIQMIELIMEESSTDSKLEFSAIAPEGDQNARYIPFKIAISTDPRNFSNFLKKIEKVPYIVAINSISGSPLGENGEIWSYQLEARVYVDNAF